MIGHPDVLGPICMDDPVDRGHPLNVGRVAWWLAPPGMGAGTQWYNLMGSRHGTFAGMTGAAAGWRPATGGGGSEEVLVDGTGARVAVSVPLGPVHSIAAWSRLDAAGNFPMVTAGSAFALELRYNGSSRQPEYVMASGATPRAAAAAVLGAWNRLLAATDGTTVTLYVNGVLAAAVAAVAVNQTLNSFGARSDGTQPMTGAIKDVSVWSRGLSAADAMADHELSLADYPGVIRRLGPAKVTFQMPGAAMFRPAWATHSNQLMGGW